MKNVFVSYAHEDARLVEFVCSILKVNEINVWRDKENLVPGQRWKQALRTAIENGTFFLSFHSKARQEKLRSYANDELADAIAEIRRRPVSKPYLIPIKIDDCEIENRDIGGGETLFDLHQCDLSDWISGIKSLLLALGVEDPILDLREPVSPGLPSSIKVQSGFIQYDEVTGAPAIWQGLESRVSGGWCQRTELNEILAYFELKAPLKQIQTFHQMLGYTGFYAVCSDNAISQNPEKPSEFSFSRELVVPAGSEVPTPDFTQTVKLPFDVKMKSTFTAFGAIDGFQMKGHFVARIELVDSVVPYMQDSKGIFEMNFQPDF